ncbi:hypothetical protein [Kitasatospora sp. NPDC001175]|uniref:hypothetical protein n=1 Tax=Kitasatospora sp. NPDC001175 TaxID=3157103 RepID=UPI003D083CFE
MSLPLTRRIAQAALLVAAGAAPLVGAGSASAADLVPPTSDLGAGLTQLDSAPDSAGTVEEATHQAGEALGTTGAATVQAGVPATADAAGKTIAKALPNADHSIGRVAGPTARTAAVTGALTQVATKAADKALPVLTERLAPVAGKALPELPGTRTVPSTRGASAELEHLTHSVPGGTTVASALPTGGVPNTDTVTDQLPGSLPKAAPLTDALGRLTGHADTHRLGGLPDLGSGNPLDSLGLGPIGQILGGLGR